MLAYIRDLLPPASSHRSTTTWKLMPTLVLAMAAIKTADMVSARVVVEIHREDPAGVTRSPSISDRFSENLMYNTRFTTCDDGWRGCLQTRNAYWDMSRGTFSHAGDAKRSDVRRYGRMLLISCLDPPSVMQDGSAYGCVLLCFSSLCLGKSSSTSFLVCPSNDMSE